MILPGPKGHPSTALICTGQSSHCVGMLRHENVYKCLLTFIKFPAAPESFIDGRLKKKNSECLICNSMIDVIQSCC